MNSIRALSIVLAGTVGLSALPSAVLSQTPAPIHAVAPETGTTVLPRNTPVVLSLNETLTTNSHRLKRGDTFTLSVAQNVRLGRFIVIPRGAKAVGTLTWRTGKGGFGKSGKMEISLDYIEIGDERIPLEGKHREEGEGNSTATMATFVFVSMLGSGLITGHSAEIPAGREFTAWTKEDVPVILPGEDGATPVATNGAVVATPVPGERKPVDPAATRGTEFGNGHIRCVTCRQ